MSKNGDRLLVFVPLNDYARDCLEQLWVGALLRSQRLLDLLQVLRRYRYPVAGYVLAGRLGVSLRTLYRDIAILR